MLQFRQAIIVVDKETYSLIPGRINSFEQFYVNFEEEKMANGQHRWALFLHPKQDILLDKVELQFGVTTQGDVRFFQHPASAGAMGRVVHTYDSGTLPPLEGLYSGDPVVNSLPSGYGLLHGWTCTFLQDNQTTQLLGSTNELTGLTLFTFDQPQQVLTVHKDLRQGGLLLRHSFPIMDFITLKGSEAAVFDQYLAQIELPARNVAPLLVFEPKVGVSGSALQQQLESLSASGLPFTHVLTTERIMVPGLKNMIRLSPFLVPETAQLALMHPDWMLQTDGKPAKVTLPGRGVFLVPDVYHAGVREYVSGLLHIAFNKNGVDIVYLEDLYAACLFPYPEKTRGQVLAEVVELLERSAEGHQMIMGGIPPGMAMKRADYWACDLGSILPVVSKWGKPKLTPFFHINPLRKRAFGISGPSFSLSKTKDAKEANRQFTCLLMSGLAADVLFTSDVPDLYDPEVRADLDEAFFWREGTVTNAEEPQKGVWKLTILKNTQKHILWCNTTAKKVELTIGNDLLALQPFETLVF